MYPSQHTVRTAVYPPTQALKYSDQKPPSVHDVKLSSHAVNPLSKIVGCVDASDYYFKMPEDKTLTMRAVSSSFVRSTATPHPSIEDYVRHLLAAPRSFENIRQLTELSKYSLLKTALRVEVALGIPKNFETNALLIQFAKDTQLPIELRAQAALGLFSSLTKYELLTKFFEDATLSQALRLECLLRIIRHNTQHIEEERLLSYLRPELQAAYKNGMPHPGFLATFFEQIAYDASWPQRLRIACALKLCRESDHSALFKSFAQDTSLAIDFRLVFAAALPKGPDKDILAQTFMQDSDTAILWASLLPQEEKEKTLLTILNNPGLSREQQYCCVSKLPDSAHKNNCMQSFAKDKSLPIAIRVFAAKNISDERLKTELLKTFVQREDLAPIFRIPCIVEMEKNSQRKDLLTRFAQNEALDVNLRFLCIAHLPKGDLKQSLLKTTLENPDLRLKHVLIGIAHLSPAYRDFQIELAKTLALNPNLRLVSRYEASQLLSDSDNIKQDLVTLILALHARYKGE